MTLDKSMLLCRRSWRWAFSGVGSDLDDIELDFPSASKLFSGYRAQAVKEGWLLDVTEPIQAAARSG